MKKTLKAITLGMFLLCLTLLTAAVGITNSLPDNFLVTKGEKLTFAQNSSITAFSLEAKDNRAASASSGSGEGQQYQADIKLLGLIPIKSVQVQVVQPITVVPSGQPFGIKIFTDGVMVVGMMAVDTEQGAVNPAELAGLHVGDVILAVDGKTVASNGDVAAIVEASGGKELMITARRGNTSFSVKLVPVMSKEEAKFKAGLWVRDSSAGIGTLTYYQPDNGTFAGLGHAVCDIDTGEVIPLMTGEIVGAEITGVTKGKSGQTGELKGRFLEEEKLGNLVVNCSCGVYGYAAKNKAPQGQPAVVAMRQQIKTGKAQILACVDGTPKLYDCKVESVQLKDDSTMQNMVIEITDKKLLEQTGGIVQGMSGSPVLQNGMLIGAVTHVFVNDPTRGYAIFAENMLSETQSLTKNLKKVS